MTLFNEIFLFSTKVFILALFILLLVAAIAALFKGKKLKGKLIIKNLNDHYAEVKEKFYMETRSKKEYKKFIKEKKKHLKNDKKKSYDKPTTYVLNFNGDIQASQVLALREEINAILQIASIQDSVILRLESGGGVVHGYGLAVAQLMRLREKGLTLTIAIDKIAASGGYMMASVANQILAAPFAIIGSIGVIVQLPNFHRWLKEKNVDFEQLTAGSYKRTLTLFGENTEEGREKMRHELEDIHTQFKNLILQYRPQVNMAKVGTGEHWLGQQAKDLALVDEIKTSDEYILETINHRPVYEVCYEIKKPLRARISSMTFTFLTHLLKRFQ